MMIGKRPMAFRLPPRCQKVDAPIRKLSEKWAYRSIASIDSGFISRNARQLGGGLALLS
jgi:hypothetical protein